MIWTISWRNVWRNPTRSLVVIVAVALGVWSLLFLLGFTRGIVREYVSRNIKQQTSHFQVHHPEFKKDYDPKFIIDSSDVNAWKLIKDPKIKYIGLRSIANGMISSARNARGVRILGIDPLDEDTLTQISSRVTQGKWLSDENKNHIILSDDMAELLGVGLKKKIVLSFQDIDRNIVTGAFRITGIFDSKNKMVDLSQVYVHRKSLNSYLNLGPNSAHEVAVETDDVENIYERVDEYREAYPELNIESYADLAPELELFQLQLRINLIIMTLIFMLALVFGIINTMLMAVLERTKELGMLLAIGMNKRKVFGMVVLETLMLSLVGTPLGLFLGMLSIRYFKIYGLDLSHFSKAMQNFGINEVVRPYLTWDVYIFVILSVFLTAVLASIYPARKATRLEPAMAIRAI